MSRPLTRALTLLVTLATVLMVGLGAAGTATAAPRPLLDPAPVPITTPVTNGPGSFAGTFDVQRFTTQDGQLMAVGTLTGTFTNTADSVGDVTRQVALPVDRTASTGSCQILDLVLGPLDLDLLGLQIHLDRVHLNITAQQGPGNLLGNLLCAIAGLLDGPGGALNGVAALLNRILGALG